MKTAVPKSPETPVLSFIPTMQPTLVDAPPDGPTWIHEIKYDGYRTEIVIDASGIRAFTRNGHDWTDKYSHVVKAAARLQCRSAIIDGEMIVQDEQGRSDFQALRRSIHANSERLVFYAFDLLHLDGEDLRGRTLLERRAALAALIGPNNPSSPIQFSEHVAESGKVLFDAVDQMGMEGVVSKQANSRYRSGTTTAWLKTKCFGEAEFYIIGIERGVGPTSILLACEGGHGLEYAGVAMLTLPAAEREQFWSMVPALYVDRPALKMSKRKSVQWLRPDLSARVRYLKGEGKLRHATIRKLLW